MKQVSTMLREKKEQSEIEQFLDSCREFRFDELKQRIHECRNCGISGCRHTPFVGSMESKIMFVGEAPGQVEEEKGEPFIGPAGILFTKMLEAASKNIHARWARENVYITNCIKCLPLNEEGKGIRAPAFTEIAYCKPILDEEIRLLKPRVIICVGAVAASTLIHPNFKISEEHGKFFNDDIKYIAIYHPSYILRSGEETEKGMQLKLETWQDLVKIEEYLSQA